jgi:pimeloyl-ACP methyl ester carboxylesterase
VKKANLGDLTLEYDATGEGEPVIFIHGALLSDAFAPVVAESALSGYRLISYRRRGYGASTPAVGTLTVRQQAADCRSLLDHLGALPAHVVGHSFGGCIALQLAIDSPDSVHSLALLEPGLMVGVSEEPYRVALAQGAARLRSAGATVAVQEFFGARWPDYREHLEAVLPGSIDRAVAHAGAWFESDLPGLLDWTFGQAEAPRIVQPVLAVLGEDSDALWARFGETHRFLLANLPRCEEFIVPRATHMMTVQNPADLAHGLAGFLRRQPMPRD